MISEGKRLAYVRLRPEDLLFASCLSERGIDNGQVQTLFLRVRRCCSINSIEFRLSNNVQTPQTSDKPLKSSTNAKVQLFLWLGSEDQESQIFKQLPVGFDCPSLPLSTDCKYLRYKGESDGSDCSVEMLTQRFVG